jgi:two-component system response regulator YesN
MIVDDEMLARVGIKTIIPWQENGMELVGEFDNGQKAFDMIGTLAPDIIITDIKMPVMDGIELIKATRKAGMRIKFIVLSAYDDFLLVKEAMGIGAYDYVLKLQMDADNLIRILENACKDIEGERKEKLLDTNARDLMRSHLTVLKNDFVKSIVHGKLNAEDDIRNKMDIYGVELEPRNLVCLVLRLENIQKFEKSGSNDLVRSSILNIAEEITSNYGKNFALMEEDNCVVLCSLSVGKDISVPEAVQRLAKDLKGFLKDSMDIVISVGISGICQRCSDIAKVYREAGEAINSNYVYLSGSIMKYADITSSRKNQEGMLFETELNILGEAIKALNYANIRRGFDGLKNKILEHQSISFKYLVNTCHVLVYIANGFAEDNNIQTDDIWGNDIDPYQQLSKLKTIDDYAGWVDQLETKICGVIESDMGDNKIIMKAKQYINQHFCESISLEEVAEQLGFSSSYSSRYFSRVVGESFSSYLTRQRINMAKELLGSSKYKVYEVASMVGYDNPHYFSRIFKKVTGCSPFEYKAQLIGGDSTS